MARRLRYSLLFPGQGAQRVGMFTPLLKEFPGAGLVVEEVEEFAKISLRRKFEMGTQAEVNDTRIAQPAILAHSAAVLHILEKETPLQRSEAFAVGGHSVGEFTAAMAASALPLAAAASLLRHRGNAMAAVAEKQQSLGKPMQMAALLPAKLDDIQRLVQEHKASSSREVVDVANHNAPTQVVISGHESAVTAVIDRAKKEKSIRRAMPLQVSAPFHCSLMAPVVEPLRELLQESLRPEALTVPLLCNASGGVAMHTAATGDARLSSPDALPRPLHAATELTAMLSEQAASMVRWVDCMESLKALQHLWMPQRMASQEGEATGSADEEEQAAVEDFIVVEIGPGSTLTSFAKACNVRGRLVATQSLEDPQSVFQSLQPQ